MSSNPDLEDEIAAINAIYEPETLTLTSTDADTDSATAILRLPTAHHLSFILAFPPDYPTASPPHVLTTASTGGAARGIGSTLISRLEGKIKQIWRPGEVCVFEVLGEVEAEGLFDKDEENGREDDNGDSRQSVDEDTEASPPPKSASFSTYTPVPALHHPPDWTLSEPIIEKKSVFLARAAPATSLSTATTYIDHLLATDKKAAQATHNITAWRLRQVGPGSATGSTVQDYDDDGETAAGGRLLHLMQLMDVWDTVVVVTRWYGGIKLGPDRFRIINAAARDALVRGGFSGKEREKEKEREGHGKKKGRK